MSDKNYRNKNSRRPSKTAGERMARMKTQRKRLVALGFDQVEVEKMDPKMLRQTMARAEAAAARGNA